MDIETLIQTLFRVEKGVTRGLWSDIFPFDPKEDISVGEQTYDDVEATHAWSFRQRSSGYH